LLGRVRTMELTEEQKERIRRNREKALEIRKRRKDEEEKKQHSEEASDAPGPKRWRKSNGQSQSRIAEGWDMNKEEPVELEDFEEGASEFVSKKDAMKVYCLPEGTLAVCEHEEKQNPRHKGWNAMKLYKRAEIRRRARERYGGLQGLIEERQKREEKRFMKDMERTKDLFK
jgi:hypothetical protein